MFSRRLLFLRDLEARAVDDLAEFFLCHLRVVVLDDSFALLVADLYLLDALRRLQRLRDGGGADVAVHPLDVNGSRLSDCRGADRAEREDGDQNRQRRDFVSPHLLDLLILVDGGCRYRRCSRGW